MAACDRLAALAPRCGRGWRAVTALCLAGWLGVAGAVEAPAEPAAPAASAAAAPDCPPQARELDEAQIRQGMREAADHGVLWRLHRRGHDSWLFGTVHIARQAWMFPGPTVLAALRASDQVALELDMLDPDIQRRLTAAVVAVPGAPLPPPALAERLQRQVERACVGHALDGLRPEIQVVTLSSLALRERGLQPAWGIDGYLAGLARGLGKPVLSLESPEAQIGLLLREDPAARWRMLDDGLGDLEQGDAQRQTERLALAWAAGRLDELESYPQWCQCLDSDERREEWRRMLDERNVVMARTLAARHQQGARLFVAVGALHMIGPQGLPALLARQGFQVERIRLSAAP